MDLSERAFNPFLHWNSPDQRPRTDIPRQSSHYRDSTGNVEVLPSDAAIYGLDRDALFDQFAPLVRRLVRRYGESFDLRQDLEGEIYCLFCAHLRAFDPKRGIPLRPYLVRLLSASVFSYARKQWRLREREIALDLIEQTGPALVSDPTPAWNEYLSQQAVMAALPLSLSRLPKQQRRVVILRFYEQRSFEEIGALLKIKAVTARSILRQGLANLRKHIGVRFRDDY